MLEFGAIVMRWNALRTMGLRVVPWFFPESVFKAEAGLVSWDRGQACC